MNISEIYGDLPSAEDVLAAARRIESYVRETPVLNDPVLDEALGCHLYVKCENLQGSGAFKLRGASNAVAKLREMNIEGDVATHSSGNHGAALAMAARLDGRRAHVVMPKNASAFKVAAVQGQGGEVYFCEPNQASREEGLENLVKQGHIPIPPYDHADIIAGQGTACLELLRQLPNLDCIVAPVGGGGLIGGTALVAKSKGVATIGAEPSGAADTADSLARGERVESIQANTIADGLRALVGVRNFALIDELVEGVITVSDDEIRQAMVSFWQSFRMLIEPSSAVVLAAVQQQPELFRGKRVGAIISGGNITPAAWLELTEGQLDA
jgi:threonine dehydratase